MVSFNLKVLAKFGLCSNCSQKLDGCSLARARKSFATACQMLVLAKISTLLACSQMLARKDPSIPLIRDDIDTLSHQLPYLAEIVLV